MDWFSHPRLKLQDVDRERMGRLGYSFGKSIGRGAYGVVYRAKRYEQQCAAKVVDLTELLERKRGYVYLSREVAALKTLKHPNLVQVFDIFLAYPKQLVVFMELAKGGDLYDRLKEVGRFDEPTAAQYYGQICQAPTYMHRLGFTHRDLKPVNILLDASLTRCMLTDYSFVRACYNSQTGKAIMARTSYGTMHNMAPEVIKADIYKLPSYCAFKADVWSAGTVLYFMLHKCHPFPIILLNCKWSLVHAQQTKKVNYHSKLSKFVCCLVAKHLQFKPEKRPSMAEIMADQWFVLTKSMDRYSGRKPLCTLL